MVTYSERMSKDEDRVFKALADPTRRFLLDLLFQVDGRTLTTTSRRRWRWLSAALPCSFIEPSWVAAFDSRDPRRAL